MLISPIFLYWGSKIVLFGSSGNRIESTKEEYDKAVERASREYRNYPDLIGDKVRVMLGDTPTKNDQINFMAPEIFPDDRDLGISLIRYLSPDISQAQLSAEEEKRLMDNIPENQKTRIQRMRESRIK